MRWLFMHKLFLSLKTHFQPHFSMSLQSNVCLQLKQTYQESQWRVNQAQAAHTHTHTVLREGVIQVNPPEPQTFWVIFSWWVGGSVSVGGLEGEKWKIGCVKQEVQQATNIFCHEVRLLDVITKNIKLLRQLLLSQTAVTIYITVSVQITIKANRINFLTVFSPLCRSVFHRYLTGLFTCHIV